MSPLLRAACLVTLGLYLAFASLILSNIKDGLDPAGSPLGYDFSAYYEAGQFALRGEAARAYDDATMVAAEQSRFPGTTTRLPWNYPPSFQLLLLPFSALPYFASFALWTALILGAYGLLMRQLTPSPALWPLLLFPGAVINLFLGANGLLVALFVGGGVVLLPRRPFIAGLLLGFATFKPHLALLIPVALLFGREYRALAAMSASVLLLGAISTLAFGPEVWLAFFEKATHAAGIAEASSSHRFFVPTFYTLLQALGFSPTAAGLVHGLVALAATAAVAWQWRRSEALIPRLGVLSLGLLIVTPYARVYDLALLAFPILALSARLSTHPASWGRMLLALVWIAPLLGLCVGALIPWLSVLMIGLLALTITRTQPEPLFAGQEKAAPHAC